MIRQVTGAGATMLLLVAALFHPDVAAAHGGTEMDQDPCVRQAGESLVHFSAYQPHAPSLEEGLFLICREALSNAIRHSGAHRVEVLAASVVDESVITIADNGRGFDQRAHALHAHDNADAGIGLNTMRERAAALGATCEISSKPGQGTRVRLRVPFSSTEST